MKGVIVAGGYGTRFLPITKSIPKEMLPLGDRPIIENIVRDLSEAGIKEILIVISEHKQIIKEYFSKCEHYEKFLIDNEKESYLEKIRYQQNLANITFVNQEKMAGFQDAVSYAKDFVGDDDFILCTGDNLFENAGGDSCTKQLLTAYDRIKKPLLLTLEVPTEELHKYGVVKFKSDNSGAIDVLVEKPKSDFPSNEIAAGRYLLPAKIFEYIEQNTVMIGHELNFSECLTMLANNEGLYSMPFKGIMFDTGSLKGYIDAFNYYTQK